MPRKPNFPTKPIPTNLFSYKGGTFSSELSTLGGYSVATEITLVNPKTGGRVDFDLVTVDRDHGGRT